MSIETYLNCSICDGPQVDPIRRLCAIEGKKDLVLRGHPRCGVLEPGESSGRTVGCLEHDGVLCANQTWHGGTNSGLNPKFSTSRCGRMNGL